jgi:hypothetical protein
MSSARPERVSVSRMVVLCKECERRVDAQVIGGYEFHDASEGGPQRFTLLACSRCRHPILIREEEFWEDSWTKPETVYPFKNIAVNEKFPERLQSAVGEMHRCFNAKAYTSTAIAGRRAIEILCADRGIKEKTLAESLARMKENNMIDGSLFEWAEGLRLAGNRAAHDIDVEVSPQDARDISEFTDALIEYVVLYRERFERFKTRQSSQKNPK